MKDTLKTLISEKYLSQLVGFLPVCIVTGILGAIDMGPYYIPFIYGIYIVLAYWGALRIKLLGILLPFVFFISFMTSGGLVLIPTLRNIDVVSSPLITALLSPIAWIFPTSAILIIMKVFFKVKLRFSHFLVAWISVSPPYLLLIISVIEGESQSFFFLWNLGMSVSLALLFYENKAKKGDFMKFVKSLD